jgi:L-rhamnose isomerase/sugar isomerase
MKIDTAKLQQDDHKHMSAHDQRFTILCNTLEKQGFDIESIIKKIVDFQVAIPSWALGAGGTRFGRFSFHGEPGNLEQKIEDVGLIHALTKSAGAISLHVPWDLPEDVEKIKDLTKTFGLKFDSMNSNTFQNQPNQKYSYKHGSLCSIDKKTRRQAVQHNIDVIRLGEKLGSKSLTVWLADGSSFPGQNNFQTVLRNTQESLKEIYGELPEDWKLFIEYKPYEPNFYSTVIQDWGTSFLLATECGPKAYTLVDLGHHLPNTNIEQIVATLMLKEKLGGFHFNDSKYGDDDLTVGSIKPYALFLIFSELIFGMENNPQNPYPAWMIDASHNLKDPLEDLIQSLEAIKSAYAKALLIDQKALREAQQQHDIVLCQEILQNAFLTDVRPLLQKARISSGGALNPLETYRLQEVRKKLVAERGKNSMATGL